MSTFGGGLVPNHVKVQLLAEPTTKHSRLGHQRWKDKFEHSAENLRVLEIFVPRTIYGDATYAFKGTICCVFKFCTC